MGLHHPAVGGKMNYYCQDCESSFENPVQLQDYDDTLVDKTTPKEDREMLVCPHCGSEAYEEVTNRCEDCGGYFPNDLLKKVEDENVFLCLDCLANMKQEREDYDV